MTSKIKESIQEAVKSAMRAQQKDRLSTLRFILAAFKQKEVDERIELSDSDVISILDKLQKQRRESITQYQAANRNDLVEKEMSEIGIIQEFLPKALSQEEIETLIRQAITNIGAHSVQDMGKVMANIKPQLQGRADMAAVGALVRQLLS